MAEVTQAQRDAAAQRAEQVKQDAEARKENAKKQLAEAQEARKEQDEARKALEGSKPTPTQEENDLAKLGVHMVEHEDDGSGPEKLVITARYPGEVRSMESQGGKPSQSYQTRNVKSSSSTPPTPASSRPTPPKP